MPDWYQTGSDGTHCLLLHIQAGAKKTQVCGQHGDALKIRLAAPPVDGKANAALIAFLAEQLKVAKTDLAIKSGHTARLKRVLVNGISQAQLERLAPNTDSQ